MQFDGLKKIFMLYIY